tara:strand:- start:349 stop:552 length:204 start_codon:yes stop_codon:yes gene_type:complete
MHLHKLKNWHRVAIQENDDAGDMRIVSLISNRLLLRGTYFLSVLILYYILVLPLHLLVVMRISAVLP